jgi:small subunit ribosomal protein S6
VKEYETVFIVDPSCDEEHVDREVQTVRGIINDGGGQVVEVQVWGKRRLAYEIKKKKEGTYAFVRFKGAPSVLQELNRRFKLNELVLRHLIVLSQEMEQEAGQETESLDSAEDEPGESSLTEPEIPSGS